MEGKKDLTTRIENTLYDIGVPPQLKGFRSLTRAIEIWYYHGQVPICNLYIDIARWEKENGNPDAKANRVERNIRNAITRAFECRTMGVELRTNIFKDPYLLKCSNSFFISTIAMCLKQEDRCKLVAS